MCGCFPLSGLWLYCNQFLEACCLNYLFSTDEKERFDPTQFQESIVQGLNQTGTDLEAVAKFLDASGAKLDYRRYAETLFDILVAGGMLGELSKGSMSMFSKLILGRNTHFYSSVWNKSGGTSMWSNVTHSFLQQPQAGLYLTTWPALSSASSRHKKTWRQCKHMLRLESMFSPWCWC